MKKTIPININLNPNPGKFIFANNVNKIASFYLSMGRKIKDTKNSQITAKTHINTNSVSNYFTKLTNASNYLLNNSKNINNKSDINKILISSKDKKQTYTLTNSIISNNLFSNGFRTTKNYSNNSKIANKLNNASISNNKIFKIQQNYTSRARYLDSRNRTKKVGMKSKMQRYKNNQLISISFTNVYATKRQFRDNFNKNINNYTKRDLFFKIDSRYGNNYSKIHKNINLYEIKNKHFRYNTTNFANKDIMNILHKRTLSNNNIYNINNLTGNTINNISNININNNIYINNDKNVKININNTSEKKTNKNNIKLSNNNNIKKINYNINAKENLKRVSKGKINDIKLYISDKKLKLRKNISNKNISSNNKTNNQNSYNFKHNYLNSLNIQGIQKVTIRHKDNINKIPIPTQKIKNSNSTQRNIQINSGNFLKKIKNNENKGKKEYFIKKTSKDIKSELNKKTSNKIANNNNTKSKEKEINNKLVINNNKTINYKKIKNKIAKKNKENNKNYSNIYTGKTNNNYSIDNNPETLVINNNNEKNENGIIINEKNTDDSNIQNISNITIYNEHNKINNNCNINKANDKKEEIEINNNKEIINDLFNEENLDDLPEDYDENFNDLYSVINKINFGRVLVGVEGFFTCEGKSYNKYKDKFNKFFDKLVIKKRNSISNSNNKPKNICEIGSKSSNAKTNYSSSKKGILNNNNIDIINNDFNIVEKNY